VSTPSQAVALQETLLVSCVNDGGVFLLDRDGVEQLSPIDTSGLALSASALLLARQSAGSHVLRRIHGGDLHAVPVGEPPLDLHDVAFDGDAVYAVSTEWNAVLQLDADLREIRRWALPGERDSAHVNSLCMHDGRLLASRFGSFDRHRGYKGRTAGAGEVFEVSSGDVLISGLSQPHSLVSHAGLLWVCDSEAGTLRAYRDFVEVRAQPLQGYVRGLAFGADAVYAGLSRSRNATVGGVESAQVLVLDPRTLAERGRIAVPRPEIYDIRLFHGDLAPLRKAALAEANAAARELEAGAEGLRAELHERDARLSVLNARLDPLQREHAQALGHVAQVLQREAVAVADLVDSRAHASEHAMWARALESEVEALRAIVEEQSAALADWRGAAESVRASRSWRLTRGLRALSRLFGRSAEAPMPAWPEHGYASRLESLRADRASLPVMGLSFPECDAPLVSVVVVASQGFDATVACLRAIARCAGAVAIEVIVVGGTDDPQLARLRSIPGLRHGAGGVDAAGYAGAANEALTLARGRHIHVLDAGSVVQAGWLEALLEVFHAFPDCGLVGSRVLRPDGQVHSVGNVVWADGDTCSVGRSDGPADPSWQHVREVDDVGMASMLLPTDVFRHLDGFDAAYRSGDIACADLAFRVRGLGMKVCVQPASAVVLRDTPVPGDGAASASVQGDRARFVEHWAPVLSREQLPHGAHPFLARDRSQLRKIVLVVDARIPKTDRDAGSRAIWQLMRVLHLQGMVIKFWAHEAEPDPAYARLLQAHGIELLGGAGAGPFVDWIRAHGRYIDHVVLSRPMVAIEYIDAIREHSAAGVVFYGHDVHHLRYLSQARIDPNPDLPGFAHHARVVEEALWSKSDLVLYPSDSETAHVSHWLQSQGATIVAATVPLFAYEGLSHEVGAGLADRRNVLFVGGFAHAPNEDAAVWFATRVWPLVRAHHPDYRLCLVGADPSDAVAALARADVLVTGYIPEEELAAYYASARVAVAPLRFGAGMKGKVLEAMRYGVPCVTTTVGAQGFTEAPLRVDDDREAFARHVIDLIRDDAAWLDTAARGIEYLEQRFSVQAVWATLSTAMDATPRASVEQRLLELDGAGVQA
jgi:glycosyltransferase involved in cell wall biosynthesis